METDEFLGKFSLIKRESRRNKYLVFLYPFNKLNPINLFTNQAQWLPRFYQAYEEQRTAMTKLF